MTSGRGVGAVWAHRCSWPFTPSRVSPVRLTQPILATPASTVWKKRVALHDLPQLEDQLFEDHAAILDRFVGMYR